MYKIAINFEEGELLLRLLRADYINNKDNDLEQEEIFEELEAKLVLLVRSY